MTGFIILCSSPRRLKSHPPHSDSEVLLWKLTSYICYAVKSAMVPTKRFHLQQERNVIWHKHAPQEHCSIPQLYLYSFLLLLYIYYCYLLYSSFLLALVEKKVWWQSCKFASLKRNLNISQSGNMSENLSTNWKLTYSFVYGVEHFSTFICTFW